MIQVRFHAIQPLSVDVHTFTSNLGKVEIRNEEVGVRVAVVDVNGVFHEEEGFVDGACLVHQSCDVDK